MKIRMCIVALLSLFVAFPLYAEVKTSPKSEIQITIDGLIKVVSEHPGDENLAERRTEMRRVIEPRFDFREMARRSLGTHWNDRTDQEKEEFVDVFSELLARTYLSRLDALKKDMVSITRERIAFPKAIVKTTVKHKGDTFPIDYKLLSREGNWKIYDVIIENIGLVANYRNEFAGIIRKEQFEGLLKRLREKNS